jgi:hypothetical protein
MKAFLFGWLIMPIIVSATITSLLPKEAKTINDSYQEISQNVTCKIREINR